MAHTLFYYTGRTQQQRICRAWGTDEKTGLRAGKMRTRCKRPPFVMQKAAYRTVKGRLLECKRRPFATHWKTIGYE